MWGVAYRGECECVVHRVVPCTGQALGPSVGRASTKFLGPGLGLHFAGLG